MPARHTRTLVVCATLAAALAAPAWGQAPAAATAASRRPSKLYTIEQFMATTSVRGASFSADEQRVLYSSDESGIFNLYSVPVPGGAVTRITSSTTDSTFAVSYFPKDDRILFTRDRGGNELNHLYVRETDAAMLREISPVFHGERIKRPLMVLQGANDPRVIQPESDDFVAAVKKNGVPVEYVVFSDEGHGFSRKKNQIEGYRAIRAFLDTYLNGLPGPATGAR